MSGARVRVRRATLEDLSTGVELERRLDAQPGSDSVPVPDLQPWTKRLLGAARGKKNTAPVDAALEREYFAHLEAKHR